MRKAGILALAIIAVTCMSGCGFEEGAGATVTIVRNTPTPIPTPSPTPTPSPVPTATPAIEQEKTESGVVVTKEKGTYVAATDVNLRADASAEANLVASVTAGTALTGTGVCENGWIQLEYEGNTAYVSGEFVAKAD